jgi:hypothetical protein
MSCSLAFNAGKTNDLMKGIGCLFAFSTCTAGYSSLILGQD